MPPKRQILDSSKPKEFADDNLKFDENDRKFSKRVENTVEKREIAHNEQFFPFPVFLKGKGLNHTLLNFFPFISTLYQTAKF